MAYLRLDGFDLRVMSLSAYQSVSTGKLDTCTELIGGVGNSSSCSVKSASLVELLLDTSSAIVEDSAVARPSLIAWAVVARRSKPSIAAAVF